MNARPLFVLTVIALHFFILFGIAHGGGFLGITVIFAFDLFYNPQLPNLAEGYDSTLLPYLGLLSVLGYLGLGSSMLFRTLTGKLLYIAGVILLWLSVLGLLIASHYGTVIVASIVFCIPFLVLSLYPFFSKSLYQLWNRFND